MEDEDADLEGGLMTADERQLRHGCWFRHFPILPESRAYSGRSLSELFRLGVNILQPFDTTRAALDAFLAIVPSRVPATQVTLDDVRALTRDLTLIEGRITDDDRGCKNGTGLIFDLRECCR